MSLWFSWTTFGFEQIVINSNKLMVKHNIFGYGPKKIYNTAECKNLRVAGYFGGDRNKSSLERIGMKGGVIAFESSGETVRFGVSLEENEANDIVNSLRGYVGK